MKTDITDLLSIENLTQELQVSIDMEVFQSKLGAFPIKEKFPFSLHLENQENQRLIAAGETDVTLLIPCGRCLEEVAVRLHLMINRNYFLGEASSLEDAEDIDHVEGTELDIDRIIYDEILINWPMKVLCKEDCKGICRKCGTNLNYKTCLCDQKELDPRMAAIQDIFQQFKEV